MRKRDRAPDAVREILDSSAGEIERRLEADVMSILGPMLFGIDEMVREAVEANSQKRRTLAIVLDTPGGVIEVVERMVECLRHHYEELTFIVPDRAMSAGTVFAMAGDRIVMDYFSCLGPIDPQVQKNGRLVPALAYLSEYERLRGLAAKKQLTTADIQLLNKLDLAELKQFKEARNLSISLLCKWLARYKFKDWTVTETTSTQVTDAMRIGRAEEIARDLSDHERWHSHGRGISMASLRNELNLRVDDLEETPELHGAVHRYFSILRDYMRRMDEPIFVHTSYYFPSKLV